MPRSGQLRADVSDDPIGGRVREHCVRGSICRDAEAGQHVLVKPGQFLSQDRRLFGFLFMLRDEEPQDLFFRLRKLRARGAAKERRQIERDGHEIAHARRAPRLIDQRFAFLPPQCLRQLKLLVL